MADVVIASQQIRIEIRLQVRLKVLTPITGNLVLIGVEQLRQRLLPLPVLPCPASAVTLYFPLSALKNVGWPGYRVRKPEIGSFASVSI